MINGPGRQAQYYNSKKKLHSYLKVTSDRIQPLMLQRTKLPEENHTPNRHHSTYYASHSIIDSTI